MTYPNFSKHPERNDAVWPSPHAGEQPRTDRRPRVGDPAPANLFDPLDAAGFLLATANKDDAGNTVLPPRDIAEILRWIDRAQGAADGTSEQTNAVASLKFTVQQMGLDLVAIGARLNQDADALAGQLAGIIKRLDDLGPRVSGLEIEWPIRQEHIDALQRRLSNLENHPPYTAEITRLAREAGLTVNQQQGQRLDAPAGDLCDHGFASSCPEGCN